MIPRRFKLSRQAFPDPRTTRGRVSSPHLTLLFGPAKEGGCAAVVSKKVAKRSVDRHLLKRRLLSLLLPYCKEEQTLVVYARGGSLELSYRALKEELNTLLVRI